MIKWPTKAGDNPSVLVNAMSAAKPGLEEIPAGGTWLDATRQSEELYKLGVASSGLGRHEEAAAYLNDAEMTVSDVPGSQAVVARIRLQLAAELHELRRYEDVVAVTERALEAGSEVGIELSTGFQYFRCEALVRLHRWAEAYVAGQALVRTVGDRGSTLGLGEVARGYWAQGRALRELGDLDLALPVLDQATEAARALPLEHDPSFRPLLCAVLIERAFVLEAMRRRADARDAYAAAISQFAAESDRGVRRLVRMARRRRLALRLGCSPQPPSNFASR